MIEFTYASSEVFGEPWDQRNQDLAARYVATWNERAGPRVGDWLVTPRGAVRFSHDWGDGIQTTCFGREPGVVTGSFCIHGGHADFSGSLDPAVPKADIVATDETRPGAFWFFHHGLSGAHRGIHITAPCRVFTLAEGRA